MNCAHSAMPSAGCRDDLAAAAESLGTGEGEGFEDLTLCNEQPVAAVAAQILAFLDWTPSQTAAP